MNFQIDTTWCLEELYQTGKISLTDKCLVQTTQRQTHQLKWHPLQWIASFNLADLSLAQEKLTLDRLCLWLAAQAKQPFFVIDPLKIDVAALTGVMSQEFAYRNQILAVKITEQDILIGSDQPFKYDWVAALEKSLFPKKIQQVVLSPEQLQRYLKEFYQVRRAIQGAQQLVYQQEHNHTVEALLQLGDVQSLDVNDQHIIKLVDWILQFAFEQQASDIHFEPRPETAKIRFRIDGVLHRIYDMPMNIFTAVIARLKILARINVAEKRKPQDGRLKTRTPKGQETELRLATLPIAFGEKLVIRIFDPEVLLKDFQQLGFSGKLYTDWLQLLQHSHGLLLITGPTGSGKTTTLYSTLKYLATDQVNVCTIEDPIEMLQPNFNQMQVNTTIDLNFATGIRAFMRQDPDIIMVGEIRDDDTAHMAIQAALTGHLVLSSLHTHDAASSFIRLHDLGIPPFLTAATLLGVLAQRLLKTLCIHCKQPGPLEDAIRQQWMMEYAIELPDQVFKAIGCEQCRFTGYQGRVAIYQCLPLSPAMKQLINQNSHLSQFNAQAQKEGIVSLRRAGIDKVIAGVTTLEEVLRVVTGVEE